MFHHKADDAIRKFCSDFLSSKVTEAQAREELKQYTAFIDLKEFEDEDAEQSGFGFPFDRHDTD